MQSTVVSFLGVGQKLRQGDARSEYRTTTYSFPLPNGEQFTQRTSLFGTALIRYLQRIQVNMDRWIILGTSASLWSELNQILPDPNAIVEQYCRIDDLVTARNVDAETLQNWQQELNSHAAPLELRLCLIGEALDPQSQEQIVRALFENIPQKNDVVFDISHGFRHLPVIATFVISLMRWTHAIRNIRFFSGVFEARQDDITPVIELPICQRLVEATEAAAVLDLTGNYERLACCLGLNAKLPWFLENTNQLANARSEVQSLRIQADERKVNALEAELAPLLQKRLQWADGGYFAERVRQSALEALDHDDYFRAVVLMYEAILIGAVKILSPHSDPLGYEHRERAEKELINCLASANKELFDDLKYTRNACAHGTRSNQARVQKIMQSPGELRELIHQASGLFDRLPELLIT